eukprot:6209790-Pleurochrysis_carterae.AAC.2
MGGGRWTGAKNEVEQGGKEVKTGESAGIRGGVRLMCSSTCLRTTSCASDCGGRVLCACECACVSA